MKHVMKNWREYKALVAEQVRAGQRQIDIASRGLGSKDEDQFGYVFGTVDGKVLEAKNQNKSFYGASIAKPIMALAASSKGIKLTPKMLSGLLNYVGSGQHDSNRVFRRLTSLLGGRDSKKTKQYIQSKGLAEQSLMSLEPEDKKQTDTMNVTDSREMNKQTPMQYFNFLVFLKKNDFQESHPEKEIRDIQTILKYMKRSFGAKKDDREFTSFQSIGKALSTVDNKSHTVTGKGGRDAGVLNYGIIIDDKYIMVIYTDMSSSHRKTNKGSKIQNFVYQKIVDVYKQNVYGTSKKDYEKMQPPPENMSSY